jgi:hypothetical protein
MPKAHHVKWTAMLQALLRVLCRHRDRACRYGNDAA